MKGWLLSLGVVALFMGFIAGLAFLSKATNGLAMLIFVCIFIFGMLTAFIHDSFFRD